MRESRIRLLTLHGQYTDKLSYFDDWLDALRNSPDFDSVEVDIVPRGARRRIQRAVREVDAVLLLHSTNGDGSTRLEAHAAALADRKVPLITFVGNELNLPGFRIAEKRRVIQVIGPEWIATQLLPEAGEYLFGGIALRGVISLPHALNAAAFRPVNDPATRPIDIGSRQMKYTPHVGDDDRGRISTFFVKLARERGLNVDISNERFDRAGWARFLNRCKGTVSTEAGSWFLERDDATVEAIRSYVEERTEGFLIPPDSKIWPIARMLPRWLRYAGKRALGAAGARSEILVNEEQSFDEILAHFFENRPRPPIYGKCISSRHFDAIGTKTCQIMFRGRFNDILQADRHYIAIEDDFSNLDDALARFRDPAQRGTIVDAAYAHVMQKHTYAHRMTALYDVLSSSVLSDRTRNTSGGIS